MHDKGRDFSCSDDLSGVFANILNSDKGCEGFNGCENHVIHKYRNPQQKRFELLQTTGLSSKCYWLAFDNIFFLVKVSLAKEGLHDCKNHVLDYFLYGKYTAALRDKLLNARMAMNSHLEQPAKHVAVSQ